MIHNISNSYICRGKPIESSRTIKTVLQRLLLWTAADINSKRISANVVYIRQRLAQWSHLPEIYFWGAVGSNQIHANFGGDAGWKPVNVECFFLLRFFSS